MKITFNTGTTVSGVSTATERYVPGVDVETGNDGNEVNIVFDGTVVSFDDVVNAVKAEGALTSFVVKEDGGATIATYTGYVSLVRVSRSITEENTSPDIHLRAVKVLS
jgi:hypothetical protein